MGLQCFFVFIEFLSLTYKIKLDKLAGWIKL